MLWSAEPPGAHVISDHRGVMAVAVALLTTTATGIGRQEAHISIDRLFCHAFTSKRHCV
jgi:hypothetical protein